jgi:hypothetical protein
MAEQLPVDLDFKKDSAATPDRMNRAMLYLLRLYSTVAALRPDYEAEIALIQTIGLERLTDALQPIFVEANDISAQLAALRAAWLDSNVLTDLQQVIQDQLDAVADDLGPRVVTLENGQTNLVAAVAALADDRWYLNHG